MSFLQREKAAAAALSMVLLLLLVFVMRQWTQQPDAPPAAVHSAARPLLAAPAQQASAQPTETVASTQTSAVAAPATIIASILPRLHSLRGATLPAGLRVDDSGALITDLQLKLLFDFLLAARHDVSAAELETLLRALAQSLPEDAAQQALQLWKNYRQYQLDQELLVWELKPSQQPGALSEADLQAVATLFERRQALQQARLGELADTWFGDDNAYDRRMLALAQAPAQSRATPPVPALPVPDTGAAADLQLAYEQQRDQLRQGADLTQAEQASLEQSLRRDFFPRQQDYVRQSLRDLARGEP